MVRRLKVRYRPEALADLTDIYSYALRISADPDTAWRLVDRIRVRCRGIGDAPNGGRQRNDLHPGLRTVPFEGKAVIAYLVEQSCVRITNIFYGGRDYEAVYGRADEEGGAT